MVFFSLCSEYKAVSEVLDRIKGVASEAIVKQVGAIYLFDVKGMYIVQFLSLGSINFLYRVSHILVYKVN